MSLQYRFKLPPFDELEMDLICTGFIRMSTQYYIPTDIIELCKIFFGNNQQIVQHIADKTKRGSYYTIFTVGIFTFLIKARWTKCKFFLGIILASLPKDIKKITMNIGFAWIEQHKNVIRYTDTSFEKDCAAAMLLSPLPHTMFTLPSVDGLNNFQTLTFKIFIEQLSLYDKDRNLIKHDYIDDEKETIDLRHPISISGNYKWHITDRTKLNAIQNTLNGGYWCSEIFTVGIFKYELVMYPNGELPEEDGDFYLCLQLVSFPPNIDKIVFYYGLRIQELNIFHDDCITRGHERLQCWPILYKELETVERLKFYNIKQINTLTIDVEIGLIYACDKYGENININANRLLLSNPIIFDEYQWTVLNSEMVEIRNALVDDYRLNSPIFQMFGLYFCLELFCDGNFLEVWFTNSHIPPYIHSMFMILEMALINPNNGNVIINRRAVTAFMDRHPAWRGLRLQHNQIRDLNHMIFKVKIGLIDAYENNGNITADICADNLEMKSNFEQYFWQISDPNIVSDVIHASCGQFFDSPVFQLHGFKFCMSWSPGGSNKSRQGYMDFHLYLVSIPPQIKTVVIYYQIILKEQQVFDAGFLDFEEIPNRNEYRWSKETTKLSKNCQQYTFLLDITIINVYDKNGNVIRNYHELQKPLNSVVKFDEYEWKINDMKLIENIKNAIVGMAFKSKYFNVDKFQCYLKFWPNGNSVKNAGKIYLSFNLKSLPMDVLGVAAYIELYIIECNIRYTTYVQLRNTILSRSRKNWSLVTSDIAKFQQLTFKARIKIIDIYYRK
eukprot:526255_1